MVPRPRCCLGGPAQPPLSILEQPPPTSQPRFHSGTRQPPPCAHRRGCSEPGLPPHAPCASGGGRPAPPGRAARASLAPPPHAPQTCYLGCSGSQSPPPARRSLPRLRRANPLPQVGSWAAERANPHPPSLPRLRREPISAPKSPLEMRREPIPSHRLLPSCGREPISAPGQLEKLPQGAAQPGAASVSSRRRTQGRAAPPSPASRSGWRSGESPGGRGATRPPVAARFPAHSGRAGTPAASPGI